MERDSSRTVPAPWAPTTFAMALVLTSSSAAGAAAQQTQPAGCCPPPGDQLPCCVGEWAAPVDLGISCKSPAALVGYEDCSGPYCVGPKYWDEIAHGVLIPTGEWPDPDDPLGPPIPLAGKVLVWTTCDDVQYASAANHYKTYVFDPGDLQAGGIFAPPILMLDSGPLPDSSGIFCSGHTWMLDDLGNPKLLVVGGVEYGAGCEASFGGMPCGLKKAYWFDPLASDPTLAWSDAPDDLPDRNWYPSVITYRDGGGSRFQPIALGGSGVRPPGLAGCGATGVLVQGEEIQWQYDRWWYLDTPSNAWSTWDPPGDDYRWQLYPRAVFLSTGSILSFGSAIFCETGSVPPADAGTNATATAQYGSQASYGGNPLQEITGLPNGTRTSPIDPNSPAITVGGWNYANVVLMHTLIDRSVYVTNLSNYRLDRVIIHGGSQEAIADPGSLPGSTDGLTIVKEWNAGVLLPKADAPYKRIFGNLVILPDGSLLAVGGREAPGELYLKESSRFWPGDDPLSPGVWEAMADRRPVGTMTPFTPRGYHSVALLLQDGSVALMGGRHEQDPNTYPEANSLDSVEIFQPPYTFEVQRLRITGTLGTMHYGTEFSFSVNKPNNVAYACLIGIGSVTHAFDYGQRYVELMATVAGNVTVWVPSDPDLLPEGYYLLFVVEERSLPGGGSVRIPSVKGRFVKVTF